MVLFQVGVSHHPSSPAQKSSNVIPNSSASTLAVENPIKCGSRADFGRGLSDHASHAHTRPTVLLPIARHRSCCDSPTTSRIDLKPTSILLAQVILQSISSPATHSTDDTMPAEVCRRRRTPESYRLSGARRWNANHASASAKSRSMASSDGSETVSCSTKQNAPTEAEAFCDIKTCLICIF